LISRITLIRILIAPILLSVASCALIVAPTGGPKDITPPVVLKESPPNKSTSFNEKKITIRFDEYVQLQNPDDQIVISPPVDTKPQFEISGKSIVVTFRSSLKPNTTYTINFGNSIIDNHEANILGNYSYTFSTGPAIDTLSIRGNVLHAFNNKPEKALSICLYPVDSFTDSTIFKQRPFYFTKTTETGSFVLTNLPEGSFRLVVFKDDNKNLKYDKNEILGFKREIIHTNDTAPIPTIFVFQPDPYAVNHVLDTFSKESGKFSFVVYKPNVKIRPSLPATYYTWVKKGKDEIDSILLFSSEWNNTDSVYFTLAADSKPFMLKPWRNSKLNKLETTLKKDVELNDSITITFNHPYKDIVTDTSRIRLKEDTVFVKPVFIKSAEKETFKIYYPWKEKTRYALEIRDSAVTDIFGQYSKREKLTWTTKTLKDYSTLTLSFIPPGDKDTYIAQIIDEAETKIYREFILTGPLTTNLEYILPGRYRIKIIRDTNGNGKWDNGDYQQQIHPEKVFYYPELLTLRAYWDLEQTIDLKKFVN
jgi:uncharacterized protein (DUF2141 family)